MEQTNRYPSHSVNQISQNTARILKEVKQQLASQESLPENNDTQRIPNRIRLSEALSQGTFSDVGMNMYKSAAKNEDYGRIWVKKTFIDDKTGEKEDWLVVYTNDEDEIIRQLASEKLHEMKKTAAQPDPKNIPIAPGIKSKDLKLNESGGAGTGTVTIEFTDVNKALKFYQEEVTPSGGEKEAPKEEEGVTPQEGNQPTPPPVQPPVAPQVQPKASSLKQASAPFLIQDVLDAMDEDSSLEEFSLDRIQDAYDFVEEVEGYEQYKSILEHILRIRKKNASKRQADLQIGDVVKDYAGNIYKALAVGTYNVVKQYDTSGTGREADTGDNIFVAVKLPNGETATYVYGNSGVVEASLNRRSSDDSYHFNAYSDEPEATDQFGQLLFEGDRVRDDITKLRGEVITNVGGGDIVVKWETGVTQTVPASDLTKWSNLQSTISEFSKGMNGVKVIRYAKKEGSHLATPWELSVREALGSHVNYNYDKYSFINENGIEIPITLPKNIKVGEMFERPDTHELVNFAGFIEKKAENEDKPDEFVITDSYFKKNNITPRKGAIIDYRGKKAKLVEEASGYVTKDKPGWWAYFVESKTSSKIANEGLEELSAGDGEPEGEASLDIHIEAEPKCIDKMIDDIIKGIDFDEDELEGGKADDMSDEDFDPEQLEKGEEVEKEHTDDEEIAKEIARDHLTEMPDYYDKLEDMESKGKKKESSIVLAKVVHENGKWVVKNEAGTKTLGTHNTKEDAEKQLQAIEINKNSSIDKKSYGYPNLGAQVGSLSTRLGEDKLPQFRNILAQFLPEAHTLDYFGIVGGVDSLQPEHKKLLASYLEGLTGKKFSSIEKKAEYTEDDFYDGMEVKLKPKYADDPEEVFILKNYDGEKGWIGDEEGRGWYVKWFQIIPADESINRGDEDTYASQRVAVSPPGRKHEVEELKETGMPEEEAFGIAWKQYNEKGKPKKESNIKLSFDDIYDTQSDFHNDQGAYDKYLNEPEDSTSNFDDLNTRIKEALEIKYNGSIPESVEIRFNYATTVNKLLDLAEEEGIDVTKTSSKIANEDNFDDQDEFENVNAAGAPQKTAQYGFNDDEGVIKPNTGKWLQLRKELINYFLKVYNNPDDVGSINTFEELKQQIIDLGDPNVRDFFLGEYLDKFVSEVFTAIKPKLIRTAADISDEVPPATWTTGESKSDTVDPNTQAPLPPKQELNNAPGDVLYDSNKEQEGQGKFQVTTDPGDKTVTVKFLDEEKALDQAINEGAGVKPQPFGQQPPLPPPGQNPQQTQFQDTNSQVTF